MQHISEETIRLAAEGDLGCFEEIYKASSGFVYNLSLRVLNNREDAQEVSQEVFLIIHSKLREFRFQSSFKTWLYRIAVNCAVSFARKRQKLKMQELGEEMDNIAAPDQAGIEIEKQEQEKKVQELLSLLSPEQRAVVVLRSMEGLSYVRIADTLGININTVRTRLSRARARMFGLEKEDKNE